MKTILKAFAIGLVGSLSLGTFSAPANLEVSASVQISATADFYAPLGPAGVWVDVGPYGRCWRPAHVAVEWRPYCDGSWVWTDAGWYWESDEPWAWACYHYGSWAFDAGSGWVWVPGIEWAPAWVNWRVGGGHIGWAPCAPSGVVIAPSLFVFVESGHFHERQRPSTVIVNNTTIINQTTQINATKRESRNIGGRSQTVVVNEGPRVEDVQKATGKKFTPVSIQEADRRTVVPAAIKRNPGESPDREKAPAVQERSKSESAPGQTPENPREKNKDESPSKREVTPPRGQVPPESPSLKPPPRNPPEVKDRPRGQEERREVAPPRGQSPPSAPSVKPPPRGKPEGEDRPKGQEERKGADKERDRDRP